MSGNLPANGENDDGEFERLLFGKEPEREEKEPEPEEKTALDTPQIADEQSKKEVKEPEKTVTPPVENVDSEKEKPTHKTPEKDGMQKRIDRLTAEKYGMKRDFDNRIAELEKRIAEMVNPKKELTKEDFILPEAYNAYHAEQIATKTAEKLFNERMQAQSVEAEKARESEVWTEKCKTQLGDHFDDFSSRYYMADQVPSDMLQVILESDEAPKVLNALFDAFENDENLSDRLARMTPARRAALVLQQEAYLKTPQPHVSVSAVQDANKVAPKPVLPNVNHGEKAELSDDALFDRLLKKKGLNYA